LLDSDDVPNRFSGVLFLRFGIRIPFINAYWMDIRRFVEINLLIELVEMNRGRATKPKKPNVEGFRSHVFAGGLIGVTNWNGGRGLAENDRHPLPAKGACMSDLCV
jgi:hypothetical protein